MEACVWYRVVTTQDELSELRVDAHTSIDATLGAVQLGLPKVQTRLTLTSCSPSYQITASFDGAKPGESKQQRLSS